MIEIISAVVTAAVVIFLMPILSKYFSAKLIASTILCSIAFIYVGFSLKDNPVNTIVLEVAFALVFYFIAVIGYARNNYLIAYGIILHGIWDLTHHNGFLVTTNIPLYWPSYCLLIDFIWGIYFLVIFRKQRLSAQMSLRSEKI